MITASSVFSSVPPLFSQLAGLLSGDIDCSHLCLQAHSTDGCPYQVRPQAVVYPKTTADIKHAIAFAKEFAIPITVAGGLTAASGGALGEGIILDMRRYFSHVRHVNMMEHTITVDAGVTIDELIDKLSGWHLEIPALQEQKTDATVGGLVATKSASKSTFHAGTIREWIEGMTVVVDSGEEHHIRDGITPSGRLLGIYQSVFPLLGDYGPVLRAGRREESDDATGYALWNTSIGPRQLLDQLVGSEGTLAVITSVTFRVVPKKMHQISVVLPVPSVDALQATLAVAKHHQSVGLFMFDETVRTLADTFHPLLLAPEVTHAPYYLIVSWSGDDEHLLSKTIDSFSHVLPFAHEQTYTLPGRSAATIQGPHFIHELFGRYTKGAHMLSTFGEGIIVSPHSYATCLAALDEAMQKEGHLYAVSGFAGSGHISLTASLDAQAASFEENLGGYRDQVARIVTDLGGGLSAVSGDGLERTAMFPMIFNEPVRTVFKALKHAWDPAGIFNPSKKIAVTKDYLLRHAVRSLL